ncbi:MAG: hypothetical protein Q4A92_08010 [Corynebacterium sp.]|nr:hypothetical protein [Corynebacterium sp.]
MLAIVELVEDELRECLQRLCAIVNADDELDMYLLLEGRNELAFFESWEVCPSVDVAWISDETSPGFDRELFGSVLPLWLGMLTLRKPVKEEFLFTKVFRDVRPSQYRIIVTNEPNFSQDMQNYVMSQYVKGQHCDFPDLRYLRGSKSCVYKVEPPDDPFRLEATEFGAFETFSEEFAEVFPNTEPV